MSLHDQITDILAAAVENHECAGVNVLVRRHGEEVLYTQGEEYTVTNSVHEYSEKIKADTTPYINRIN